MDIRRAYALPELHRVAGFCRSDVACQLSQVQNLIAAGVDAIVVNPVDTSATQAMTDADPPPLRWSAL